MFLKSSHCFSWQHLEKKITTFWQNMSKFLQSRFTGRRLLNFCRFHPRTSACVQNERITDMRVFPQGISSSRRITARPRPGAALIWRTYTPHLNKNNTCVPQRFTLPHFSLYQDVWISLCMELLWLPVGSSPSQRQRSPKCVCEQGWLLWNI